MIAPEDGDLPAGSLDRDKARRAARDPERPGDNCRAPAGTYIPVVDHKRCEGKRDCVAVCPYGVFEVRHIDDEDFAQLGVLGRLKSRAHGRQTAYTPRASECHACGLCVVACPEDALTLVRR
jgi:NAD-dependent dihydropyrimidine dehydrogenase PreA subunit